MQREPLVPVAQGAVQDAGHYSLEWDGRDDRGGITRAGLYFTRLEVGGERDARRLVRLN